MPYSAQRCTVLPSKSNLWVLPGAAALWVGALHPKDQKQKNKEAFPIAVLVH
jgi:hypothetical protein